jgi:hypothetical protein
MKQQGHPATSISNGIHTSPAAVTVKVIVHMRRWRMKRYLGAELCILGIWYDAMELS